MSDSKLVAVYSCESGLASVVAYVRGKLPGPTHCALCDITHGYNPLGKKSWKEGCSISPIPIEEVHLDEMDERTQALVNRNNSPAIVLLSSQDDRILLNKSDLESCNADPQRTFDLINRRLAELESY